MECHSGFHTSLNSSDLPLMHMSPSSDVATNSTGIPSPVSTVVISTPIIEDEDYTGVFSMDNQDSFNVRGNNSPVDENLETTTFLNPVTPLSPSRALSTTTSSSDPAKAQGDIASISDQKYICTAPSSSEVVQPLTCTEIPIVSNAALPCCDIKPNVTSRSKTGHVRPESVMESYITLTPWTTRLTSQSVGQMPLPSKDSLPLPMLSLNHHPCIPASTNPFHSGPGILRTTSYPVYSKIGSISPRTEKHGVGASSNSIQSSSNFGLSPMHKSKIKTKTAPNKEHRFKKTADALQKSGLWEVAMKTGNLIKRNRELQKDLEQFRADALVFLKSVIKNPQNRDFIKNVLNNALSSTNSSHQKKASMMSVVVSAAAAAASMKLRSSSSLHDSGISSDGQIGSSGSQSDQSVSNFSCIKLEPTSDGSNNQMSMDIE